MKGGRDRKTNGNRPFALSNDISYPTEPKRLDSNRKSVEYEVEDQTTHWSWKVISSSLQYLREKVIWTVHFKKTETIYQAFWINVVDFLDKAPLVIKLRICYKICRINKLSERTDKTVSIYFRYPNKYSKLFLEKYSTKTKCPTNVNIEVLFIFLLLQLAYSSIPPLKLPHKLEHQKTFPQKLISEHFHGVCIGECKLVFSLFISV